MATPTSATFLHGSGPTYVTSSVVHEVHSSTVQRNPALSNCAVSTSVYELPLNIRKFTSAIRASNSKDEVNRLIKLFSNSSPFKLAANGQSHIENSDCPAKSDELADKCLVSSDTRHLSDIEVERVSVKESLESVLTSSTKSYSWNSSLPNGSKLEAAASIAVEETGRLSLSDKPANDRRLLQQDSTSIDTAAVSIMLPQDTVAEKSNNAKKTDATKRIKEATDSNSRQIYSKTARKTKQCDIKLSDSVDTTLQKFVKPKLACDGSRQPSVLHSIENVSEHSGVCSQDQRDDTAQFSSLSYQTTNGRKTLRVRDVAPRPLSNDIDKGTTFVSPRRSSIVRHARQSVHEDSRHFNQSHFDQSRFDQSAILLSSTLRLPETDAFSSQLSTGSLMDTFLDPGSAIQPSVQEQQQQSEIEHVQLPAVQFRAVQTQPSGGISLCPPSNQSTPMVRTQKLGKIGMYLLQILG